MSFLKTLNKQACSKQVMVFINFEYYPEKSLFLSRRVRPEPIPVSEVDGAMGGDGPSSPGSRSVTQAYHRRQVSLEEGVPLPPIPKIDYDVGSIPRATVPDVPDQLNRSVALNTTRTR